MVSEQYVLHSVDVKFLEGSGKATRMMTRVILLAREECHVHKRRTVEPARGNVGKKREMIIRGLRCEEMPYEVYSNVGSTALYICLSELEDLE